jgi:PBP1b-binding outer membrane lipoprotein LpoB
MKKTIITTAVLAALVLASCGTETKEETATPVNDTTTVTKKDTAKVDSTAVKVDTTTNK